MEDIIAPISKEVLKSELTPDRRLRFTNKSHNEIYIVTAHNAPNVMLEIGRLREIAFRAGGGGTGCSVDIDEYDTMANPYKQLVVWNPEAEEILGGYRYLCGDEVEFDEHGKPVLATAHMFDFSEKFLSQEELACIRRAMEIGDEAFEYILTYIRPGISELDVAAALENCMRQKGSQRPSFDTIVASGKRGSLPHGTATEKLINVGEFVTMDYGAVYKGYHSDMTRTVCMGRADEKQRHVYSTVLKAQELGVSLVQPGASGKEVDRLVRQQIAEAGYGRYFGHGLGHSVGLEIHEEPRLSPSSTCEALAENMLVTVEPGIYIPDWGGVRIEDTVVVKEGGCEILTHSPKELIELGV